MKTELKYGLITIVVGTLWVLAEHIAGLNATKFEQGEIARMIFAFLPFVFLFMGIRAKKKITGKITYLAAWGAGSLIALIFSVGLSVWFWAYASFINTEFLPKAVAWENAKLVKKGLTGQALEDGLKHNTTEPPAVAVP